MKYLKTFESYKEEIENITVDQINSKLDYTWNPDDLQIWRGLEAQYTGEKGELGTHIYHREDTERKSRGGMWKILKELPSWKKFSNRARSIPASSDDDYAKIWSGSKLGSSSFRGRNYIVIPLKNEIFVGTSQDFNTERSFPFYDEISGNTGESSNWSVYSYLRDLYKLGNHALSDVNTNNYVDPDIILSTDEDFFDGIIDEMGKLLSVDPMRSFAQTMKEKYGKTFKYIKDNNFKTLEGMFDHLLDPERNGYVKMRYTDFITTLRVNRRDPIKVEVWFESDCYMVSEDDFNRIKSPHALS